MEKIALFLVVAVACFAGCKGYGSGAPESACVHMTPIHVYDGNDTWPLEPRDDNSPFTVTVSTMEFGHGGEVEVTVAGSETFAGFLLQARQDGEAEPVGTFSGLDTVTQKFVECSATYPEASVTHNAMPRNFAEGFTLTWTAPNEDIEDVTFYATVAIDHDNYWVMIESEKVTFSGFKVLAPVLSMLLIPVVTLLVRFL